MVKVLAESLTAEPHQPFGEHVEIAGTSRVGMPIDTRWLYKRIGSVEPLLKAEGADTTGGRAPGRREGFCSIARPADTRKLYPGVDQCRVT